MLNRIVLFFRNLWKLIKSFPTSLFIGMVFGILLLLLIYKSTDNTFTLLVIGAIIGVFFDKASKVPKILIQNWKDTHPKKLLLSSISKDNTCYIYYSSFFRDQSRRDEFKLLLPNPNYAQQATEVVGPQFVLGDGDALALSLILSLLSQADINLKNISLERGDRIDKRWDVNIISVGAHSLSTREILSTFDNKYFIFDNNYTVITRPNLSPIDTDENGIETRKGVYTIPQDDISAIDYDFIIKFKNQFLDNEKTVFVIAGINTEGTIGAAYYFLNHSEELSKLGDEFGILIQTSCGFQSARRVDFESVAGLYVKL